MIGPLSVALGAGCRAMLTWPDDGVVVVEITRADGVVSRRVRGPWTRVHLAAADPELRHIATQALRRGAPPVAV